MLREACKVDDYGSRNYTVYVPPIKEGTGLRQLRNLERDLSGGRDVIEVDAKSIVGSFLWFMFGWIPAVLAGGTSHNALLGWLIYGAGFVCCALYCAAMRWDMRQGGKSIPVYRLNNIRWSALESALSDRHIYTRLCKVLRSESEPLCAKLDPLVFEYFKANDERMVIIQELSEQVDDDECHDRLDRLKQKLEESAELFASKIVAIIDAHDEVAKQKAAKKAALEAEEKARDIAKAEVIARENRRLLCQRADMLLDDTA